MAAEANTKQKRCIRTIKRRRDYLVNYLKEEAPADYPGVHWDKQEIASLNFALECIDKVYPGSTAD